MPQALPFLAGFFGAAAPAIGSTAFGAWAAGVGASSFLTTTLVGKLLSTVALSGLAQALQPKPKTHPAGIRAEHTMTGGTTPASFILGKYASEGQLAAPPMSHGKEGNTPNAYLTYVIELGDIPGQTLEAVFIDGTPVTLGGAPHADYGLPVEGRYDGYAWIKYYDGTQTTADPMLLETYGSDPERPWSAAMIGSGICYAICTFRINRQLYSGFPRVRFVLAGIPLYDPRRDTTVGGSGAHRWHDPATWAPSENPAIQIYNILRGVRLPSGDVWGGEMAAGDLPLSNWFAAMNAAEASVALSGGGTEPTYRASYEVFAGDEPASVVEELLKACSGQLSEGGGIWKIRIGGPGLPIFFFSDDDVNIQESQRYEPFQSIGQTWNGIHARYPAPEALWQSVDAPPRYNAAHEAADGDRRLVADLTLPAAPYPDQVQRLMRAYIEEERRMARHTLALAPEAIPLEPLDVVAWTSTRHGYTAKEFEISAIVDPLVRSIPQVSLRERDATDYGWTTGYELPQAFPSLLVQSPELYSLGTWGLAATTIEDGAGAARRPALLITWEAAEFDDVDGLAFEVRLKTTAAQVTAGITGDFSANAAVIATGILANVAYEVRVRPVATGGRAAEWSLWSSISAPHIADGSRAVSLSATEVFFRYDVGGSNPTPATATIRATTTGTVGTPFYEFLVDGVSQQNGISDTFVYTPPPDLAEMPETLAVNLREDGTANAPLASDVLQVFGASVASDAILGVLSNAVHACTADADGANPNLTGSGTRAQVYFGTSKLTHDGVGTSEGTYAASAAAFNGTITPGGITTDGQDAVLADHSGFGSDTAVVRITVSGVAGSNAFTILLDQSLSKAKAGVPGSNGADGLDGNNGLPGSNGSDGADGSDGTSTFQAIIYKRSVSTPSTPSGGSYNFGTAVLSKPSGWYDYIPGGSAPVFACRYMFSITGTTGIDSAGAWSLPKLVMQNGVDGADGADGANGTNGTDGTNGIDGSPGDAVAVVYAFKESASAPTTPSGGQFAFSGPALTPPSGWSAQPPAATDRVWVIQSVATAATPGGTDTSLTWTMPRAWNGLDGADGAAGSDGVNGADGKSTYQAAIYKRAVTAPPAPSGGSFNFGTNALTPPSGWSETVPTGANPVYVSRYLFFIVGDTGIDSAGTWSTPVILAQNGVDGSDGADGVSTYLYPIYRRSGTIPSTPAGGVYDFGANAGTPPSPWLNAPPAGSDPLYLSTALASVSGATGTDTSLVWTAPTIISGSDGLDGVDGSDGADGTDGGDGARGPGRWHVGVGSLPASSSAANTAFNGAAHTPSAAVEGDQAWFYTGTLSNPTAQGVWIFTSGSWLEQTEVIDGNLFVSGTVTAGKLSLNGIMFENVGGQLKIKASGIDTSELADDSVTVFGAATGTSKSGNGGYQAATSVTISLDAISDVTILWNFEQAYTEGIGPEWGFAVKRGATTLESRTGMQAVADYPTGVVYDAGVSAGSHTYALDWHGSDNASNPDISALGSIIVLARQK